MKDLQSVFLGEFHQPDGPRAIRDHFGLTPVLAAILLLCFVLSTERASALGQTRFVQNAAEPHALPLVHNGVCASLVADEHDFPGVLRAVGDLQQDFQRVSGCTPQILHGAPHGQPVLIGTIGKSPLIDALVRKGKIDVSAIQGKWEATLVQVVEKPMPGVAQALVIAGSDKRGTIFGIYDVSEQIGVSPWYWWADVPVQHSDALYVKPGRWVHGEPAVKYRGIFLNDEAPALTGWVHEKFGGYNHQFYVKVFELLLRLRANYLWPAMWNSAFNEDDPLNPKLADEYGIVMGTSHHEPMIRAQQEWKRHGTGAWNYATNSDVLKKFWEEGIERNKNYESVITLGMRGDGDMPMSDHDDVALLEKVVADQRAILARHMTPTLATDPQVWALYKEVQGYYEKGMRVPDDVTLLWSDDNWGNIRRLPTPEERKRKGGAGIYYHVDYVGGPRSYKWLNTYNITKIWEQMNLARAYGADRIWILNVGDLKPMEVPIEFFLDFARDPDRWGNNNLQEFMLAWATREFGPEHASEIADIVSTYTKYNARRKPEQLEPDTFSLTHFHEAERVAADWKALTERAEKLYQELPANQRDAFYELALYPTKASALVNELYITAGMNHFYAAQGRVSTNDMAQKARELFAADAALSAEYNHSLLNGKWDHMMDQTHIGYTFWSDPPLNAMPAVSEVQPAHDARMAVSIEGIPFAAGSGFNRLSLPAFDDFNRQTRTVEVFNRGTEPFTFTASANQPWIVLSQNSGTVGKDTPIKVSVDWTKIEQVENSGAITFTQPGNPPVRIAVNAMKPAGVDRASLDGFVEAEHLVSIEAEHFASKTAAGDVRWERIPGFGETLSGMTILPVTAPSALPPANAPTLEYRMYLFDQGDLNVEAILAPTLNFVPGRGLRYAISFDDQAPQIVDALAHDSDKEWAQAVSDGVRKVTATLHVDAPGYHTLKFRMVDPGVVLEKLVVSKGAVPASYLGPPESYASHPQH